MTKLFFQGERVFVCMRHLSTDIQFKGAMSPFLASLKRPKDLFITVKNRKKESSFV